MEDSSNSSPRELLITSVGKKSSYVRSDLTLPVQQLKTHQRSQSLIKFLKANKLHRSFYLVFIKFLYFQWDKCVTLVPPLFEIIREMIFQLKTAALVQIVYTSGYPFISNTADTRLSFC